MTVLTDYRLQDYYDDLLDDHLRRRRQVESGRRGAREL